MTIATTTKVTDMGRVMIGRKLPLLDCNPKLRFFSAIGPSTKPMIKGASGMRTDSSAKPSRANPNITQTSKSRLEIAKDPITQKQRMIGNK